MDIFEMIGVENVHQIVSGVVRLVIAALCGALIGLDRERRRRPAGLRTHMLVCLGAALVMITGEQIQNQFPGGDVARMGAQVISGIGFLGAGTIIVDRRNRVRGLTTAAGLWTSACIGLAIGAGYYLGGIITCILTVVIVAAFLRIERRFSKKSKILDLYVECKNTNALYSFISHISEINYRVVSFQLVEPPQDDGDETGDEAADVIAAANISLRLTGPVEQYSILRDLTDFSGLISVREV